MADFDADPDALDGVAEALSTLVDSGPGGRQPPADDCGSSVVSGALDSTGSSFLQAWTEGEAQVCQAAAGAAATAEAYRTTEDAVESSTRSSSTKRRR